VGQNSSKRTTVNHTNRYIISGSIDGVVNFWEIKSGKRLNSFKIHSNSISSLKVGQNDLFFISASKDRTIQVWSLVKFYLEENIEKIDFNAAIKLINEKTLDLKPIIDDLIKKENFEYLHKILQQTNKELVQNAVFEYLLENIRYTKKLFNYIDKVKANELFDEALKIEDTETIEFLLQKDIKPTREIFALQKYLAKTNRIKEVPKFSSKYEIFKFLKSNLKYVKELFSYIEKERLIVLLEIALNKKDIETVVFLLEHNIFPKQKDNFLFEQFYYNNTLKNFLSSLVKKELIDFLFAIKTVVDKNDLELLDVLLEIVKESDKEDLKEILKQAYKEKKKEVIEIFKKHGITLSFFERIFLDEVDKRDCKIFKGKKQFCALWKYLRYFWL